MQQQYLSLFFALFLTSGLMAQTRYLDEVFTDVNIEEDVEYGKNFSILLQDLESLQLDVYTPAGDDVTERPVFLYFHTGSFLPQYINNQITGGRKDSTVVEICKRLARRGYVAASVSYRAGWLPTAQDQDTRTGSLLQAAYRGVQDMKTAVRYFRHSVAKMENPYGIDTTKIGLIGQGTGGYIAFGAYLDTISEAQIPKFIDSRTLDYYVIEDVHGNVQGTNTTQLNEPNHVGYTDDVQFVMEFGGAMGDINWLDGEPDREPPVVGFHVSTDPFAPFADGAVIVPVTNQFVVNVSGPRTVVQKANDTGVNAVFEVANQESNALNDKVAAFSSVPFDTITLATENFYPFVFTSTASGPWEWWNFDQLSAEIDAFNDATGEDISAVTLDFAGKLTNPDMSKEKAMRYIDTIMNYTLPRAYYALDLANISSVDILDASKVELEMYPNPATDYVVFRSAEEMPIQDIAIYNIEGRLMHVVMDINNHAYEFQRKNLAPGMYVVKMRFDEGILSRKLVIRD